MLPVIFVAELNKFGQMSRNFRNGQYMGTDQIVEGFPQSAENPTDQLSFLISRGDFKHLTHVRNGIFFANRESTDVVGVNELTRSVPALPQSFTEKYT